MGPMFSAFLSNVSMGTANVLSYSMLLVVTVFLLFFPAVSYYFWRQSKKAKPSAATASD